MRTYKLLVDEKLAGRMLLDDDGTGHVVLDCLPRPLTVIPKPPGERWTEPRENCRQPASAKEKNSGLG